MSRIIRVYVAAPYTSPNPVQNTAKALAVGGQLLDLGYVPFVPHMNMLWDMISPRPGEQWLQWDLHWLAMCDVLLRDREQLPGLSPGADKEEQVAHFLGIPVVYSVNELQSRFSL